ncbi:DEAD/DEAH box helicase [Cellulomonas wangsupingiae]|uniref:RNA helicase n=1 Tax=Cellulomonas wangsupingiae TaxID=2968085 RepID=A0ABY5K111_9CELL|nr:DEAD/DEAH box helicase [Cellulomonas wangsupingiae]MCC2333270.1 DEAD/DEAH box helicase [Cellulomonas wangsupingiae]UUI63474.1 DEAD/DEAH box helicase [Cellulomonas wangsupingiae]
MSTPLSAALPTTTDAPATFADLGLSSRILSAVERLGFAAPTPVQTQTIPALLAGRDVVGVAQTGTGKTAAFGLPLLQSVDPDVAAVQVIVLTPTRELAMQVADAISSFAVDMPGLQVVPVYGGSPYLPQQRALARGAQVVVGTPGRVIDHIERRTLRLEDVRFVVLDEADEMLRMGFAEDVDRVLSGTPSGRQVALFSATMPTQIRRVADQHLVNPVSVSVTRQSSTVDSVRQTFAVVPYRHKAGALARVLAVSDADAAIVFVRTREAAEEIGNALVQRGIAATHISGDVAQSDRERIVERLRSGALDVLVATDVAARGLDVERIGLVVNLDLPREPEAYVHRIGRTGRAGRSGEALTFVTPSERPRLRQIERTTRTALIEITIPTPAQVSAHRATALLNRTEQRMAAGRLDVVREAVREHLAAHPELDPLDLLTAVAALAVGDEGPGADVEDLDDAVRRARDTRADETRGGPVAGNRRRPGTTGPSGRPRYRVSVGERDGLQPGALVGALTGEGGLTGKDVGKIDIYGSFALVDIPEGLTAEVVDRLGRTRVAGRPLRIRLDTGPQASRGPSRGERVHRAH